MFKLNRFLMGAALLAVAGICGAGSAVGAELKALRGHVPSAARQIAPIGRLAATNDIQLVIGVPLRDPAGLERFLAEVSDPASPAFRQFLTPEEFTARFAATESDYAKVKAFAQSNHLKITGEFANRLLLDVRGKAADVERAFRVKLHKYKHPTENREFFAPDAEPIVDAALPVADVQGLSDYPRPQYKARKVDASGPVARSGSGPGGAYLGDDFRRAYVPGTTLTGAGQQVGLIQFDGFYSADIAAYAALAGGGRTNILIQTVLLDGYGGGITDVGGNGEVSLDIEMAMAMAPGLAKIVVFEGNPATGSFFPNHVLSAMASSNMIKNLSCSWGWGGGPDATTEAIFQQMAAQGQSFFNASGDYCAFTIGAESVNGVDNPNTANYPSSSPYITQVGGTELAMNGSGVSFQSETTWNWNDGTGSSGGVSSYYAIPWWQTNISMVNNGGSTTFRNIPDVALTADNVHVKYNNGGTGAFAGTSAAAPLWAGFMALVNQKASSVGNPPVGLINPPVYAIGRSANYNACFHDITTGNNFSADSPALYAAVVGYDLCTGWGTPSGTNLINALAAPNTLVISPMTGFVSTGPVGGPFTVTGQTVLLTNISGAPINWALSNNAAWLTVSPKSGTLAVGGKTNLTIALAPGASALAIGNYSGTIAITNITTSSVQGIPFSLQIGQQLLANGGFESGDFTGWTVTGSGGTYNYIADSSDAYVGPVHGGTWAVALGESPVLATLTQTLATTPGQDYQLTFWVENQNAAATQIFRCSWNGTNVYAITNPPAMAWTKQTFLVTATGTNTALQFAARNDPYYWGLDDVSVLAIPTPSITSAAKKTNGFALTWNTLAGLSYRVEYKTNLLQSAWINLATNTASGATLSHTNTVGADPRRFYRIRRLP